MRVKVEFEARVIREYKDNYAVELNNGKSLNVFKETCTIIEEPVVYNVGDIVEYVGDKAIVVEVNDEILNVRDLSGHDGGWIYKKYVKLLKKASYEEEE